MHLTCSANCFPSANYLLFFMSNRARFPEAIAAGHKTPLGANPFLWSSNLWEAFNIGQYLAKRGISPDGFRKSRGSRYVNNAGLVLKYHYDAAGWFLEANR